MSPNGTAPQGSGAGILYLDDEEPQVFLVTRLLKRLGYEPSGFTRAAEALTAFKSAPHRFALVLTDLSMPGTSGIDFAREVLAAAPRTPVVIVTGCVEPADVTRATAAGVRSVIQKPLKVEELGSVVGRLMSEIAAELTAG
jgi:two-component system cell cycle sensor histidine kinase/response regulator CckA